MTRKGRKVTGGEGPPTHALIHHTLPELRAVQGQKGQKNKKLCEYFSFLKASQTICRGCELGLSEKAGYPIY